MSPLTTMLANSDRTSIERWCRQLATAVTMPGGDTLCRVLGTFPFVVTLQDHEVAPHLALDGYWEMWNTICLARRIKKGWKCIDVGANFGYYTVLLSELVGLRDGHGHVEAWEPAADLVNRLRSTLDINGLHCDLVQCAAGRERSANMKLTRKSHHFGSAQVVEGFDDTQVPGVKVYETEEFSYQVRSQRLDHEIDHDECGVDFVKIDAEGHEPQIWEGMSGLFERNQPHAMLMEWTPRLYMDAEGFMKEIVGRGYTVSRVDQHGDLAPLFPEEAFGIVGHLDLWLERTVTLR